VLEIRPARADEREAIASFLHHSFKAKIAMERWRALLDGRWASAEDGFGVVLLDGGELAGFLGVVHAERPVEGGMARTGNLTSWYLRRAYRGRGLGLEMLRTATADPGVTYTTFSSVPRALRLMERAGLVLLDDRRMIWRGGGAPGRACAKRIKPVRLDALAARDAAILRDHDGLNLETVAVEVPGAGVCLLVLSVKRKHDDYLTYEVLYLGQPDVFARHARVVADAILPDAGAVLSVDWRFVGVDVGADGVERIPVPRFYSPGRLAPRLVDLLYSETVLLDLKLY
jgi:RimJ/RimL family protein N-acetyltransferase